MTLLVCVGIVVVIIVGLFIAASLLVRKQNDQEDKTL